MKFTIPSIIYQNAALLWLGVTLLFWWAGFAGRDIYLLPALVFFGVSVYQVFQGTFSNNSIIWLYKYSNKRYFLSIFWFHAAILLATTILKYYSFQWNIWDVGNHSNMLFNISRGQFYSSYLGVHNWADHFTPSMSPLALFYLLVPSTHWITIAKTISYISVPILIFKICREAFDKKEKAWIVTLFIGFAWMLFYSPALNSLFYEFQSSALAPPFILYAFLCFQRQKWIMFWLTMIFLLGFKEHLGVVWIGLGSLFILTTKYKKIGIFLIIGGIISIYLIMFKFMPFFRSYEDSWSMPVGYFHEIPEKLFYLFKLLTPLGYFPLIFWRIGILAGPAIGINLISSNPSMYSTSYHYDDISATLLMIVMILIFSSSRYKFKSFQFRKVCQWLFLVWCVCVISLLSPSPMRNLYAALPKKYHIEIRKELIEFDNLSKNDAIAVQTSLGPMIHRKNILAIADDIRGICMPKKRDHSAPKIRYLVFARKLNHYLIEDLEKCLMKIKLSKDFKILKEFQHLVVFKKN